MKDETKDRSWLATLLRPLIFLILAGFLFAIIWPIFARMEENRYPASCQSNLKQIGLGTFMYLQDYSERYPLVNVHDAAISPQRPLGWSDALQPYLKSARIYQCPSQASKDTDKKPNENGYTDYWYNARLNALEAREIDAANLTLLNGDGNDGTDATNARYSLSGLPPAWAPSQRHLDGANYGYTDGHVKWSKPQAITTKKPDGKNATFLVK